MEVKGGRLGSNCKTDCSKSKDQSGFGLVGAAKYENAPSVAIHTYKPYTREGIKCILNGSAIVCYPNEG